MKYYMHVSTATALLVDDDVASYEARQQRLEDDGYSVILARDGAEGLSRARQSTPDVIFTHLVAGLHDNIAFIQSLRSDDARRHISVIVLTGRPESGTRQGRLRPVNRDRW
jgi:CheY-like chemotaxis protein